MIEVVVGAGFGDEGKGITVARLCEKFNYTGPSCILNVKFSGGPQAGHTVYNGETSYHVFSTLGAGSFAKNVDTFLWKTFAFNPLAYLAEMEDFENKFGYRPTVYVHGKCPIITPLDILENQSNATNLAHGTVGSGVGATFKRHEKHNLMLYANDFKSLPRTYVIHKLQQIAKHYGSDDPVLIDYYYNELTKAFKEITVWNNDEFLSYDNYVFEGSQGFYLDRDFGFFPNVTRSYCTVRSAVPLITYIQKRKKLKVNLNMVSRCYLTRHGNGPFDEIDNFSEYFSESKYESNNTNLYQGRLKRGFLDIGMLKYAITVNASMLNFNSKSLYMTCLDQITNKFPIIENGNLIVNSFDYNFTYIHTIMRNMGCSFIGCNSPRKMDFLDVKYS